MSKAQKAVYNILSNAAGVTSLVSTRIYPQRLPAGVVYPAITYQRISDVPWMTKNSYLSAASRVQINVFSKTNDSATAIETAVIAALNRVAKGTYNGVKVETITYENSVEFMADNADNDGLFYTAIDFMVYYG